MRDTTFKNALITGASTIADYKARLFTLAYNRYIYDDMPDEVDLEYLEQKLTSGVPLAFFRDEFMGFMVLPFIVTKWNVYMKPYNIQAYSSNGYRRDLGPGEYVIIHSAKGYEFDCVSQMNKTAKLMAGLDRMIEVNVRAMKTPCFITCDESQVLTYKNLFQQYDGDQVLILGNKSLGENPIQAINTGAVYHAEDLYGLKVHYWNECMTLLGIPSISFAKKERMIQDEVRQENGGSSAFRLSQLQARQEAVESINKMFGLSIKVSALYDNSDSSESGDPDANGENEEVDDDE